MAERERDNAPADLPSRQARAIIGCACFVTFVVLLLFIIVTVKGLIWH